MPDYFSKLIDRIPELAPLESVFEKTISCLEQTYHKGGKIMTCGNGGSAADAEHIVGELMKGFLLKRKLTDRLRRQLESRGCPAELCDLLQKGVPAISLVSGVSLPTAFSNDVCAEAVFAQQVLNLGHAQDVLIAISTSGNSKNVIAAMQIARALDITTIGLTGNRKGQMNNLADILIAVPSSHTPAIQEYHLAIYHAICAELESRLFADEE